MKTTAKEKGPFGVPGPRAESGITGGMTREEAIKLALEAIGHIREEADFNRSWTDGRRGAGNRETPAYYARRIEVAKERDRWAAAIEFLIGW